MNINKLKQVEKEYQAYSDELFRQLCEEKRKREIAEKIAERLLKESSENQQRRMILI